ncbi:hypothetical protein JBE27_09775, partial [Streptomyces albiflaviniger]|nr:hypothetical protein [Streptomyces albiflaviniger]
MADSWATPRGEPGRRADGPGRRADGPGRRADGPGQRVGGPAGPGTDLHLDLPRGGGTGVRDALIRALRDAVRGGRRRA